MKKLFLLSAAFFMLSAPIFAQDEAKDEPKEEKGYEFTEKNNIPTTTVKDQQRTGTCWSYAATSFVETELLRMGFDEVDLSEMYFVRHAYEQKGLDYVRYHGKNNFSPGGQAHDVTNVIKTMGFVTENDYTGKHYGSDIHVHGEMRTMMLGMLDAVIKNKNREITPVWFDAYKAVVDTYLGAQPEKITYNEKEYTPVEFAEMTGFDANDYIEITSYNHQPYYEAFDLELPDNWSHDHYYNLPIDELMEVMDYALANGYSVCWDGDVSEKGFSHKNGLMILPETNMDELQGSDRERWEGLSSKDISKKQFSFEEPVQEVKVTQESRQKTFNNYKSTDDHLMHLVGTAKDQNGTMYYLVKNSWDSDSNDMGGYLYMSENYARMKTVAFMIHKDALPKKIAKKLGLK
jgi:bleomycin hydrolase